MGVLALEAKQQGDMHAMLNHVKAMEKASVGVIDNLQRMADSSMQDASLLCH